MGSFSAVYTIKISSIPTFIEIMEAVRIVICVPGFTMVGIATTGIFQKN